MNHFLVTHLFGGEWPLLHTAHIVILNLLLANKFLDYYIKLFIVLFDLFMGTSKAAFLLTCHNRLQKTKKCLTTLFNIIPNADVYLVDDKSTDGTREMVLELFPSVHLLEGSGNLFWTRGMHLAWKNALKGNYDFYIWLNDDIILYPYFYDELFSCYEKSGSMSIITGIIIDIDTKQVIYGGTDSQNKLNPLDGEMHDVRDMNGNVVLVPKCVVEKIGIMDSHLHHGGGDTDYGYTARENGIKVKTTTRAVAEGYKNSIDRLRKWNTNIFDRFKTLYSPMGSNPNIGFYFFRKHFGLKRALLYYVYLHLINIPPDWMMTRNH